MNGFTFEFTRNDSSFGGDADTTYPPVTTVVEVSDDSSLHTLVAALRIVLRSAGFSDRQARQVVVLPIAEVDSE